MNGNKKTKLFAGILAIIMIAGALSGCAGGSTPAVTTDGAETEPTTEGYSGPYPVDGPRYLPCITYDGYTFTVLMSGLSVNKFSDFSEDNGENYPVVNEAIYRRNKTIEDRYDITINTIEDFSTAWGDGNSAGYRRISSDYLANDCSYDICAVGTFDAPQFAINGFLCDLNEIPNVDLSQKWWDSAANRDLAVGGKMYYTTGEISLVDNIATHIILFNKDLAARNSITDLYELVETGKWTLDSFITYVKYVSEDLDGSKTMDEKDRYGLMSWNDCLQATMAGSGSKIATVDTDGSIILTLYSEKNADLIEKLTGIVFDHNYSFNYVNRSKTAWQTAMIDMFSAGQGLFFTTYLASVPSLRDTSVDFGILPYPKYDESQEKYSGYVPATYNVMYCVEATNRNLERTGVLLEALAYESMVQVTPAFYDQTLIGRYIRDDESAVCLDLIFANRTFDLGIYYLIGNYTGQLTNMMKAETNRFTNIYETYLSAAKSKIEQLNTQFGYDK